MFAGIAALENSEKYSDFRIICGDQTFNLHRAVVCTQSDYFARMVESKFMEASTGVVTLQEDDPDDIGRMVTFLYHGDYDDGINEVLSPGPCLPDGSNSLKHLTLQAVLTNVAMYAIGEKYLIPHLKSAAAQKFSCWLSDNWKHGVNEVVDAVYNSTPGSDRTLRNSLVQMCVEGYGTSDKDLDKAMEQVPDAHVDVLKELLSGKECTIVELRNNIDNLSQALENETTAKSLVEAERTRLQTTNRRLTTENRRLRNENRTLTDENVRLKRQSEDQITQNENLRQENNEIIVEKEVLRLEKVQLEDEKRSWEQTFANLSFRLSAAEARLTEDPVVLSMEEAAAMDAAITAGYPEVRFPEDAMIPEGSPELSRNQLQMDQTTKWSIDSMINKAESGFCLHCGKEYNVYVDGGRTVYEPCCESCRSPAGGISGINVGHGNHGREIEMGI